MWLFSPLNWNERLRKARERKNLVGFSLAELIVVVAIIAILAAITTPIFLNQKKKAHKATVVSDGTAWSADIASMGAKYATFGAEPISPATVPNYNGGNITLDPITKELVLTMPNVADVYTYKPSSLESSQTMTTTMSPGSTIRAFTAGSYTNGYVAAGRTKQWCFIAENNTQTAVFTQSGYVANISTCPQPVVEDSDIRDPIIALAPNPYYNNLLATITPPASTGLSPVIDYTLEYRLSSSTNWIAIPGVTTTTPTSYTIPNLTYGESYQAKVRARNSEGMSNYSNTATATVPFRVPDSPTMNNTRNWGTSVTPANPGSRITQPDCSSVYFQLDTYTGTFTGPASNSINIQTPGFTGGKPVDKYELNWRLVGSPTWSATVSSTSTNILVTNIPSNTSNYEYQIRAHSSGYTEPAGWSAYTTGVFTRTVAVAALPPTPTLDMSTNQSSVIAATSEPAPSVGGVSNGVYASDADKKDHKFTIRRGIDINSCGWTITGYEIGYIQDRNLPTAIDTGNTAPITIPVPTNMTATFTGEGDRTYAFKIRAIGTNGGAPTASGWSSPTQDYLTVPNQPETHFLWWWNRPDWSAVPTSNMANSITGSQYPQNNNNVIEPFFSMNYGSGSLYRRGDSEFMFDFNSYSPNTLAGTDTTGLTDYGQLKVLTGNSTTTNLTNPSIVTTRDTRGKMKANWTRFDSATNVCNLSFFGSPFQAMCQKFQLTGTTNYYMAVRAQNDTGEAWASNQKSGPDNNSMALDRSVAVSSNTARQSIRSAPQNLATPMMSPESFNSSDSFDVWNFESYDCSVNNSCLKGAVNWVNNYDPSQNKYLTGYSTQPTSTTQTNIGGVNYWTKDLRTNNPVEASDASGAGTRPRFRLRENGWDLNDSANASTWNISPQTHSYNQAYMTAAGFTANGSRDDRVCRQTDTNAPPTCVQGLLKANQSNPQLSADGQVGYQRMGWRKSNGTWRWPNLLPTYNVRACNYEITNTIIQCTTSPATLPARMSPGPFTYAGSSTWSLSVKRIDNATNSLSWYARVGGFLPYPDQATASRFGYTCKLEPFGANEVPCANVSSNVPGLGFAFAYLWSNAGGATVWGTGLGAGANGCPATPAGWTRPQVCPGAWVTLGYGLPVYEYLGLTLSSQSAGDNPIQPISSATIQTSLAYANFWNSANSFPRSYKPGGLVSCWKGRSSTAVGAYQGADLIGTGC